MHRIDNTDKKEPLQSLLSIEEVADLLGVDVRHVRRLRQERRIPYIKWGHLLRFDPAEIQEWLQQHRRPSVVHAGSRVVDRLRSVPNRDAMG